MEHGPNDSEERSRRMAYTVPGNAEVKPVMIQVPRYFLQRCHKSGHGTGGIPHEYVVYDRGADGSQLTRPIVRGRFDLEEDARSLLYLLNYRGVNGI